MSKPLGYFDPTLPENTTPAGLIESLRANAVACGWQVLHQDTSSSPYIDLIQPTTQTIGNSLGREVIRLRAPSASSVLDVYTYLETLPGETHLTRTTQYVGSLPVDYTYGFIYYLAVMERTLLIGTKTNTALYGALFVSYADNSLAVAATPPGLIPVELVGGSLASPVAKFGADAVTTHCFGYLVSDTAGDVPAPTDPYDRVNSRFWACDAVTGTVGQNYGQAVNVVSATHNASYGSGLLPTPLVASFAGCGGWAKPGAAKVLGNPVTMASCGLVAAQEAGRGYIAVGAGYTYVNYAAWLPALPLPDVTAYLATAVNEGLHLVRSLVTTTLQTEMDGTSDYPTITLGSTADLPASGTLVIGDECIPYSGKAGSTATGCARAAYATTKAAHSVGTTVYLASWVVKVNGGAVHAGYTKPGN